MKRPWQIWLVFVGCLLVVLPAMVWLTSKTLQLDRARRATQRQTELARSEAELEERVNSALWRMDWLLTPLVAQEAARPHFFYKSFYQAFDPPPTDSSSTGEPAATTPPSADAPLPPLRRPSPLLVRPSRFVRLHFEITAENEFLSPQLPLGPQHDWALACGLTPADITQSSQWLADVQRFCTYPEMIIACSIEKLPAPQSPEANFKNLVDDPSQQMALAADPVFQEVVVNRFDQQQELDVQADEVADDHSAGQLPDQDADEQQVARQQRGGIEFDRRSKAAQSYASSQWAMNSDLFLAPDGDPREMIVREGVMRGMWFDQHLLLARRVEMGTRPVVQCCWLDWPEIESALLAEIADTLPDAQLRPVDPLRHVRFDRVLATLPIEVVLPVSIDIAGAGALDGSGGDWSASSLQLALAVAWLGLVTGSIAIGLLLAGVIRLSERRASFVSAVTHELRTPLTTFRMYAEMLAERMVPDPGRQQQYAHTLCVESDRLARLVNNVLEYARLERGRWPARHECLTVAELVDRQADRLEDRCRQCGMQLHIALADGLAQRPPLTTDPAAVEQIVFNLIDNACKYAGAAADKRIDISIEPLGTNLIWRIRDYGPGIDRRAAGRLFRPFAKSDQDAANSAPGVGLGLALARRLARALGGSLEWQPSRQPGAEFVLTLPMESRANANPPQDPGSREAR
jgi:signal transduction histidine kinase